MPAPATPSAPPVAYNDNAPGFGSRYELFQYGGTAAGTYRGWYCLESIRPSRPGKIVERPNPLGGPNGFAIVAGQERMTAKAQLPSQSAATLKIGDWFQDSLDPSDGTAVLGLPATGASAKETWVVESTTDAFEMNGYWYQDLNLILAHNPPS